MHPPIRASLTAITAGAVAVVATGCPFYGPRPPLELPATPAPLTALNSRYDDYNSAAPDTAGGALYFSTNRGSAGAQFDLVATTIRFERSEVIAEPVEPFEPRAMSPADELGPEIHDPTLVFTSDRSGGSGGFDLYRWTIGGDDPAPVPLAGINGPGYDGYWTLDPDRDRALFASDRDGHGLDAYLVTPALGGADGAPPVIERVAALSTEQDETAFPWFTEGAGRYLLFASDRAGGAGDYDLYCARQTDDGGWDPPRPLSYANTPYREFRPIVVHGFFHDVLLFSSSRPGGMGGMDLYYAALDTPCAPDRSGAATR